MANDRPALGTVQCSAPRCELPLKGFSDGLYTRTRTPTTTIYR